MSITSFTGEPLKTFMVIMRLPQQLPGDFLSLIPEQREYVASLLERGTLSSYALALDRSRIWTTVRASSDEEVMAIVDHFPLRRYLSYDIIELAFHNSVPTITTMLSMN